MEQIINYIKPELLVLIPVLYFVGLALKKSEAIRDKSIPLVLGAVAVLLSVLYLLATTEGQGYRTSLMAIFVAITQGVLCAGMSVYTNEILKQAKREE